MGTVAGSLTYETNLDTRGYQKGINDIQNKTKTGGATVKSIIAGLGITKLVSKAFDVIRSSMDGAISRLDTMNNFPKVMSNLGIGARESTQAINKLSEGLQGIPTTLDAGALAVQRFTSKNGDVQKSVDIFLAVNDAILAGGASTEIQASALEQLSQSYAKGKMDMMEWRTIQTAMPAQLKQVASAMGVTTDELGEMLRTGDNTEKVFDEFINTIIKMDKTGVKGFKSLKEQARNATGGIQTSITNMKTAITRGVANMIQEFDKVMRKKGLGGISENITKIGKQAENMLKNVGKWMPPIIDILLKAINVLTKISPAIIGIVTAVSSYKVAMGLATTATNLFTSALTINPLLAFATAIAGIVTASALLSQRNKEVKTETEKLNDTLTSYDSTMKEIAKSRKEYLQEGSAEINSYERLYAQLQLIVDENGKVKEGYEEKAKFITGQLSEALGVEIELIDGQIQGYNDLKKSVEEAIKAKKAEILLEAYEEQYKKALKERADLQKAYTKALKENKDIHAEYNKTMREFETAVNNGSSKTGELAIKLKLMKEAVEKSDGTLKKAGDTLNSNQEVISKYEIGLEELANKNYDAVTRMYNDTLTFNGKTKEANDAKYNQEKASLDAQLEYLQSKRSQYDEKTYEAMRQSLLSQLDELKKQHAEANKELELENATTYKLTVDGLNSRLNAIKAKGVEFRDAGNGNVQLYVNGIAKGKPIAEKTASQLAKDTVQKIKDKKISAEQAGEYLIEGVNSGINSRSKQSSVFASISSFAGNLLGRLRAGLQEHSPSKASEQYGKWLLEGLNLGIDDEKSDVLKNIDEFSNDIVDKMANAVNVQSGKMAFSGTSGSINQILTATGTTTVVNENKLLLDGDVIYENQKQVTARKNLQTQFGGAYNVSN